MKLKRTAACIAAIFPIALLALVASMHGAFAIQRPHHAPGPRTQADAQFFHRTAPDRAGHLIGWVNHLVGPFTTLAANL